MKRKLLFGAVLVLVSIGFVLAFGNIQPPATPETPVEQADATNAPDDVVADSPWASVYEGIDTVALAYLSPSHGDQAPVDVLSTYPVSLVMLSDQPALQSIVTSPLLSAFPRTISLHTTEDGQHAMAGILVHPNGDRWLDADSLAKAMELEGMWITALSEGVYGLYEQDFERCQDVLRYRAEMLPDGSWMIVPAPFPDTLISSLSKVGQPDAWPEHTEVLVFSPADLARQHVETITILGPGANPSETATRNLEQVLMFAQDIVFARIAYRAEPSPRFDVTLVGNSDDWGVSTMALLTELQQASGVGMNGFEQPEEVRQFFSQVETASAGRTLRLTAPADSRFASVAAARFAQIVFGPYPEGTISFFPVVSRQPVDIKAQTGTEPALELEAPDNDAFILTIQPAEFPSDAISNIPAWDISVRSRDNLPLEALYQAGSVKVTAVRTRNGQNVLRSYRCKDLWTQEKADLVTNSKGFAAANLLVGTTADAPVESITHIEGIIRFRAPAQTATIDVPWPAPSPTETTLDAAGTLYIRPEGETAVFYRFDGPAERFIHLHGVDVENNSVGVVAESRNLSASEDGNIEGFIRFSETPARLVATYAQSLEEGVQKFSLALPSPDEQSPSVKQEQEPQS